MPPATTRSEPGRPEGRSEPRLSRPRQVAEAIKQWVMDEGWQPGHRLPSEAALMARFAMAKSTIREAIRLLEAEGLVRSRTGPGGGVFVHRVSEGRAAALLSNYFYFAELSIDDIYQMRRALEPELAASLAGKLDDAALARLETAIAASGPPPAAAAQAAPQPIAPRPSPARSTGPHTPGPEAEPRRATPPHPDTPGTAPAQIPRAGAATDASRTEADEAARHAASLSFHAELASMSGNPLLGFVVRFLAEMLSEITVARGLHSPTDPALWNTGAAQQTRLVAALRAGDAEAARQVSADHMAAAHRMMRAREANVRRRLLHDRRRP